MSEPKRFAEGLYFALPRQNAPEFVLGSISIKADPFIDWLNGEERNDRGYVNFDVLMSKEGKPYIVVNNYQKVKSSAQPKEEPTPLETEDPF